MTTYSKVSVSDLVSSSENKGMDISDGMYPAVIVGYAIRKSEFVDDNGSPKESIGAQLIMQVKDDSGNLQHIASTPMKASLHEKASLRKMLVGWLKKSDLQGIIDQLTTANIIVGDSFSWDGFIGKKPLLMISMTAGKKDANKLYAQIKGYSPLKQDQGFDAVLGDVVPDFFVKDAIEYKLMTGVGLRAKVQQPAENPDLPF